jgi:hypothetical protein
MRDAGVLGGSAARTATALAGCAEKRQATQTAQRARRITERLLHDVVHVRVAPEEAIDHAGHIPSAAPVEGREGALVPLARLCDERRVLGDDGGGVVQSCCHARP